MEFGHYTDPPAALAVELVNGFSPGDLGDRSALVELVARYRGREVPVTSADVHAARALADRLRSVFEFDDAAEGVERLNTLLAESRAAPYVSGHDGHDWHFHFSPMDAGLSQWLTATAATGVATVVTNGGTSRLGVCADTGCEDVFVDASRNNRRRYCGDGCANRSNVAAFRARAKSAG